MTADIIFVILGLAMLVAGGEVMIRGATGLASGLGVSPLAIGLTVVAFGTSAPELAVNVNAALLGKGGVSFGNIIGSNMANIGLIVGLPALIKPISIRRSFVSRELPMMLLATVATMIMCFDTALGRGPSPNGFENGFSRGEGLVLLLLFLIFLFYTVGDFVRQRGRHDATTLVKGEEPVSVKKAAMLTLVGLVGLVGGANVTVDSAVAIAQAAGVSDVIIGLTMLAIGTSLPELVASIMAIRQGHVELAIGNVVGSNIFNLLLVLGVTNVIRPFAIPVGGHIDLAVMLLLSVMLMAVSITGRRRIIRTEAALLLLTYVGYMVWRSMGAMGT